MAEGMDVSTRNPVKLLIAYGTSTGTSKEVARRIARDAHRYVQGANDHYFIPLVMSLKELTVERLIEIGRKGDHKVIFIVSTSGQGEFPDDSKLFWKTLCKKEGLKRVPIVYAVIGLGDSSYNLYNYPAKKLHKRLTQLDAIPTFPVCLCDDQHDLGVNAALDPFLKKCWMSWIPPSYTVPQSHNFPCAYTVSPNPPDIKQEESRMNVRMEKLKIIRNERVTATDHFQDTRLIAFDSTNSKLMYKAGDALRIYPENFPENVKLFFELFPHLQNQDPFYLNVDPTMKWMTIPPELLYLLGPQPWTWETVVTHLLDLQSIPGAYGFEILRAYTPDSEELELMKSRLAEYAHPEHLQELYDYVSRPRRTILEVLKDFSFVTKYLEPHVIFELIPFMRPRAFSIASPPKEKHHIEVLVAVVKFKTKLKKSRKGTCSYWLAHYCNIGQPVGVYCEKGSLRPPSREKQCNVIMIGPGTGVAPFRSMIKHYMDDWNKYLFFGCRNIAKDYYFGQEMEEYQANGKLHLYPAFSRDGDGRKVDYVQDVIRRKTDELKTVLDGQLPIYIFVCGSSGDMPKDVHQAIKEAFEKCGLDKPDDLLKKMLLRGQYQTETY